MYMLKKCMQKLKLLQKKLWCSDLLLLYYDIETVINEYKTWGNKFIDNLSYDIQIAFPERKGYSVRNLKYMAKFVVRFFC